MSCPVLSALLIKTLFGELERALVFHTANGPWVQSRAPRWVPCTLPGVNPECRVRVSPEHCWGDPLKTCFGVGVWAQDLTRYTYTHVLLYQQSQLESPSPHIIMNCFPQGLVHGGSVICQDTLTSRESLSAMVQTEMWLTPKPTELKQMYWFAFGSEYTAVSAFTDTVSFSNLYSIFRMICQFLNNC